MADLTKNLRVNVDTSSGVASLRALGSAFSGVLGPISLVITALTLIGAAAIKSAKDFIVYERQIIKINTLLPRTERGIANVKEHMFELEKALPNQSTEDLADSLYNLTSLTGDVAEATALAEKAGKTAIGTNGDMVVTTEALTTTMKVFNLSTEEAAKFLDEYQVTINSAVISGEKVAPQLGEMSIFMKQLGGDSTDTLAVLSAIGGSLKEEQIKTGLKAIANDVEKNKEKFVEAGIETENFTQMIAGLDGKDLNEFFNSFEAKTLVRGLLEAEGGLDSFVAKVKDSEGAVDEATTAYFDTVTATFDSAGKSVELFKVGAGESFAEIGAAFIEGLGQENIDEMFDNILSTLKVMVPVVSEIASLLGTTISDSTSKMKSDFEFIEETVEKINYLFGITDDETEEAKVSISDIVGWFKVAGNLINPWYYAWQAIKVVIGTIADTMVGWKDLFTGQITLVEQLGNAFGGNLLKNVYEVLRTMCGIKDEVKEINDLSGTGMSETYKTVAGKDKEMLDWAKRHKTGVTVGPLASEESPESPLGIGGGTDEEIKEKEEKRVRYRYDAMETAQMEFDEAVKSQTEAANEEDRRKTEAKIGELRKDEADALESDKKRAKSWSNNLISAIRSGDVVKALQDIFLNQLWSFVSEALSRAILNSGILALLNVISAGGAGAVQGAGGSGAVQGALADGGYFHKNQIHYAADGLYLANKLGTANVLKSQLGGVPVIAAEAGVDEVNVFAPLNQTGWDLLLSKILPMFPQYDQMLKNTGSASVQSNQPAQQTQNSTIITVNPMVSQLLDISISESANRGNRIKSNRTVK